MSVSVIIGGQFGSEGKGKIASYLSSEFDWAVKSGGPNSGHTVYVDNTQYKLRVIPSAFTNPQCNLAIAPAALTDVDLLLDEADRCGITSDRLFIDQNVTIIDKTLKNAEISIVESIGSTGQGVGAATIQKIQRVGYIQTAKDVPCLAAFVSDVPTLLHEALRLGKNILLEGSQGFGLSITHGHYPYVTSRETTAGTLCSDCGIGPLQVSEVYLVIRTYPIRVGGNSGPLPEEIDWETITERSGSPRAIAEYTTVTNRMRRVGEFNIDMISRAAQFNSATKVALNFVDYIDYRDFGKQGFDELTFSSKTFINMVEDALELPVALVGTGPLHHHIIDRR